MRDHNAMPKHPCVYLLASKRNGTLYCGVTSDIARRVWLHRQGIGSQFTAKYGVTRLVWREFHDTMPLAILREKRIKNWRRAWKLQLIESQNPDWDDLYDTIMDWMPLS